MINKKDKHCIIKSNKICNFCGDCYEYRLLDIAYFYEPTEEDINEDEIIEKLFYESERESDSM